MNTNKKTVRIKTKHLHLDHGEDTPAIICCTPGEPLQIEFDSSASCDIDLPDECRISLARVDPHVHFRECLVPTREEFEEDPLKPTNISYEDLVAKIKAANALYDVRRGSLAALKGGVWLAGAMGNTLWAPLGEKRWKQSDTLYQDRALIFTHLWPRIEPGVDPIPGQEEKDFGSTFGCSGLSPDIRKKMYLDRSGGMISYHNDKARDDETIEEFRDRVTPPDYMLHHMYYDGDTVLASQKETFALAREAKLKRLLTRHIPTGPALDMILSSRSSEPFEAPSEVGLDYLYFNRDMLEKRATCDINFRRPALPSEQDQASLIALTRQCAQKRDPLTFIGSDHAPHALASKQMRENGLPGAPGTRILEHSLQVYMHLMENHGYNFADIDWLTSIAPAKYIAQYKSFPYPVGSMETGCMANLAIFSPEIQYKVDEDKLRLQLKDQEYHSAYRDEALQGEMLYTVVNGTIFDVQNDIRAMNTK
jgi:dihydroorotase-like cyclic amidohydrolase